MQTEAYFKIDFSCSHISKETNSITSLFGQLFFPVGVLSFKSSMEVIPQHVQHFFLSAGRL